MLIKDPSSETTYTSSKRRFFVNIKFRTFLALSLIFLIIFSTFLIFTSQFIKTKGYSGLTDFTKTLVSNMWFGRTAKAEKISITIAPSDFQKLENKRRIAMERNLLINEEDSYVPATITYGDKEIKVKLRLKGHMTDHLKGDKWSYRIKVKDKNSFMGMKTFSIQHPGTRGYIYEWVYHRLLKEEGVVALRYKFIEVTLNGKDLGVYAVEEHFDDELASDNDRLKGPVFRFNPNLYWVDRYNEILKDKVTAEFAYFTSSNFETYREKKVLSDSLQYYYFLKGTALIEAFRRRELPADSVFDIKKQAKFFAVMDLLGGHFSMDWSDIKFYYNPLISRLEPVGYESCSLYPVKRLAGTYRFKTIEQNKFINDFHDNLFSNIHFFREYMKQVGIISDKQYLDDFFLKVEDELNENLKIIYSEFPYKKFEKELYYKNQKSIKRILDTPKAIHSYYDGIEGDSLRLQIGVIESLPVEIIAVLYKDEVIAEPVKELILDAKKSNEYVNIKNYSFLLNNDFSNKKNEIKNLAVKYRLLGTSQVKQAEVFPYPYKDNNWLKEDLMHQNSNYTEFPFLYVNEADKVIFVKQGKWNINKNLIIPEGYIIKAFGNTFIDLTNSSKIISFSPLDFTGTEEMPVIVFSSDSSGKGIAVFNTSLSSRLKHVHFKNLSALKDAEHRLGGAVTFYEAEVNIDNCLFSGGNNEDALNIISSKFFINRTLFENTSNDAVDIKFSNGKIMNSSFINCTEDAIDITSGNLLLTGIIIKKAGNKGINAKAHAEVIVKDLKIEDSNTAVSSEDMANVNVGNVQLTRNINGFVAYQNKSVYGPASITASAVKYIDKPSKDLQENKSNISVNGRKLNEDLKNVEKLLKQLKDE